MDPCHSSPADSAFSHTRFAYAPTQCQPTRTAHGEAGPSFAGNSRPNILICTCTKYVACTCVSMSEIAGTAWASVRARRTSYSTATSTTTSARRERDSRRFRPSFAFPSWHLAQGRPCNPDRSLVRGTPKIQLTCAYDLGGGLELCPNPSDLAHNSSSHAEERHVTAPKRNWRDRGREQGKPGPTVITQVRCTRRDGSISVSVHLARLALP